MSDFLLEIKDLKKYFQLKKSFLEKQTFVKAVDGVSLKIKKGQILGLVGESGCGKSTLGRLMLNLIPTDAGSVLFEGKNILELPKSEMRDLRKKMQIIFQDPFSSLNPRFKVKDIVAEGLKVFDKGYTDAEITQKVKDALKMVGLNDDILDFYPHQFSGGQRQRISIARAIILEPQFIVCDEPVSALDVSIQAQIINLLKEIKDKLGLSYLFIAHDLSVVRYISDRIAVIYKGKIVEEGNSEDISFSPLHPYTKLLIDSVPKINQTNEFSEIVSNDAVKQDNDKRCVFADRCPLCEEKCLKDVPVLKEKSKEHFVACFMV